MRGSNKKVRRLSQRGSRRFAVACSAWADVSQDGCRPALSFIIAEHTQPGTRTPSYARVRAMIPGEVPGQIKWLVGERKRGVGGWNAEQMKNRKSGGSSGLLFSSRNNCKHREFLILGRGRRGDSWSIFNRYFSKMIILGREKYCGNSWFVSWRSLKLQIKIFISTIEKEYRFTSMRTKEW